MNLKGNLHDVQVECAFAKETVMLDVVEQVRPEVEVEVQAIQVGNTVFVSNPGDYFVQYGPDIKKAANSHSLL